MNVKVIDESINKNDQSHQNVDNTKGRGAKVSLFLNTTHELTVKGLSEIHNTTPLHGSIPYIQETKTHQIDSFHTNKFADTLDSQGSSSSLS